MTGLRAGWAETHLAKWRAGDRGQLSRKGQASTQAGSPKNTAAIFQTDQAQRHTLTSLSWKGLERMVRVPSSMDFWILAGICSPRSLS